MKNVEKFLGRLGIKAALLATITGTEELPDEKIEELATGFLTTSREALENDPEFIEKIKAPLTAKERATLEGKIKKAFGLSSDEIKDKKIDEIIEVAKEKSKTVSTLTAQELQDKYTALVAENKRLVEEVIPEKENQAMASVKAYRQRLALRDRLSKKGDSLLVGASVVMPALTELLSKDFTIDIDDDDNFIVKTKKDGLDPLREDKTGKLTFDEILDAKLTEMGVLKKSNAEPGGTPKPAGSFTPATPPTYNLPGMARAKENEAEMGKMRTFGSLG